MHPLINHLIQLQELNLIRDERKVAGKTNKDLAPLDENISAMTSKLPTPTRGMYGKLFKKDHTVICPVSQGFCAGCGLQLPISLVQEVKMEKDLKHCPSCTRFLYVPASAPRRVGRGPRRTEPRKMGIGRFSAEALMIPRLESTDRDGVIGELATAMEANGYVDDAQGLLDAAIRREEIVSTAVEHGLAFPHVRGVEGGGLTIALGMSKKGVDFGGTSRLKTRFVFFIVIPTAASAFYLKLLAGLAEAFADKTVREEMLRQKTQADAWKELVKVTRKTVK